jgi:uncharacterized lipoprotein YddW (UPF0748 family)
MILQRRFRTIVICASILCSTATATATATVAAESDLPRLAVPKDGKPLADLDYADSSAAARVWSSVYGSARAEVAPCGDRRVLKLPCKFVGNKLERGCWECAANLDLTPCRGVTIQVLCRDMSVVTGMTLYLQSGAGWYGLNFNPETAGTWCSVELDKSKAIPEGSPAGWGHITKLRFSAWRGAVEGDVDVYLGSLSMLGADAPIVLLDAGGAATGAVHTLGRLLQELELPYFAMAAGDLKPEHLRGRTLVIVPGGANLKEAAAATLKSYREAGGKLLVVGKAPPVLGSPAASAPALPWPGDSREQCRKLLDVMGEAAPSVWNLAVTACIERIGRIGDFTEADQVAKRVKELAEKVPDRKQLVMDQLGRAEGLRADAVRLQSAAKYREAMDAAAAAREAMTQAYCLAQTARPGEQRLFWCHSALGVEGRTWDESIRTLAENGFTGILPNMVWGGIAYYRSDVLPVWPELASRGDQLAECLAACKKYGVQCHVWKVNWYMSGRSPKEFLDRMKREGRTQVEFDGSGKDDWLCPSHPANQQLEIDAMVEVATKYDVDGIHFDYIRYPGPESCFCPGCRERFERHLGRPVANWPSDTRQNPEIRQRWLDWRRSNITAVVAGVAERMRADRPGVKISAAVFRILTTDRDSVGQDWKVWCDKHYLDFICPMDYTPNVSQFRSMVRSQMEWAGSVPCVPGIGLSVWPDRNDICRLIDQIDVTRELGTAGFTVFNYSRSEADVILPLLGKGMTRPK